MTLKPIYRDTLAALRTFQDAHGYAPTLRELMPILDISSTSVMAYRLQRLQELGYLTRGRGPRAMTLTPRGIRRTGTETENRMPSHLESTFALILRSYNLPAGETEYRFHAARKWRFDFAWPLYRVAVELEGGVYSRGRHTRASGFIADCDKYNAAALDGWRVLRYTASHLDDPEAVAEQVRAALEAAR